MDDQKVTGTLKALNWLMNNFPLNPDPEDDCDKLSNAIHVYAQGAINSINELVSEITILQEKIKNQEEIIKNCDDWLNDAYGGGSNK